MDTIFRGLAKSIELLLTGEMELYSIALLTLRVSLTAIAISSIIGIPIGIFLGLKRFRGRKVILAIVNIFMGLPPVVAGLWITMILWRSGPLGDWSLLFSPTAIIMAQVLVSLAIIIGLTCSAFQQIDEKMLMQIKALGATKMQSFILLLKQTKIAIFTAIITGFGRVIAEVGAAMMVGGNIKGETRILTTTIVMEVSKGNFDLALALSFILLGLAFLITFMLTYLQQRNRFK